MSGALIVTAEMSPSDFGYFEGLRRAHFPPERNFVPAHLTLFHALPPSAEEEVRRLLARHAAAPPPAASLDPPYSLGNGVAFRIRSEGLDSIREEIAGHFHGGLTAQDSAGWRAHVTVQNKVAAGQARALLDSLSRAYRPRPIGIAALALHRYRGGPWEGLGRFAFRGAR